MTNKFLKMLYIPTGTTMLNCACSDSPFKGYKAGTIITLPGSSASGKTMLVFTMFAEICADSAFNSYKLIYDDAEESFSINIPLLFGDKVYNRVIPPKASCEKPIYSETIQDFKNNLLFILRQNKPFIYVLDSLDALSSESEMDREYKLAIRAAKDINQFKTIKGQQIADKAREIGKTLRIIRQKLGKTKSLLIIIQQERANIGRGMFQPESITSGGRAPFFYSSHQIWMKKVKGIRKENKKIGNRAKAMVLKNKITGKERTVEFDIYNSYGIDDLGSQIDFLVQENYWRKKQGKIEAKEFTMTETKNRLIRHIEKEQLQGKLKQITGEAWKEIEGKLKLQRKQKYD